MDSKFAWLAGHHLIQVPSFPDETGGLEFNCSARRRVLITVGFLASLVASCDGGNNDQVSMAIPDRSIDTVSAGNASDASNEDLSNAEAEAEGISASSADGINEGEGDGDDSSLMVGRFFDSVVEGLAYKTDSLEGYTGSEGNFQFVTGENVVFFVGDPFVAGQAWELGGSLASEMITPLDLADADTIEPHVINLLRFLQTLDMDGNADNGIKLPSPTEFLPDASADVQFSKSMKEFENDTAVLDYISRTRSLDSLVSDKQAIEHFQRTLNTQLLAPEGRWSLLEEGASIEGLQATIEFSDQSQYVATVDSGDISIRILARYEQPMFEFESEFREIHVSNSHQQLSATVDDGHWSDVYSVLTDLLTAPMRIAIGLDARLSILPSGLVLESEDREILLHYVQVSTADPIVDRVQLMPIQTPLVQPGQQLQLEAAIYAEDGSLILDVPLTWVSSDDTVLSVSNSGLITVHGSGVTTITVATDGKSASLTVEVQIPTETEDTLCPSVPAPADPLLPPEINELTVVQLHYNDNPGVVEQENNSTIVQNDNAETVCETGQ